MSKAVYQLGARLLLVAAVIVGAAACEKVPKPTSDSTPPALNWHVENRTTSTSSDHAGSGTVTGKKGDDFRVTVTAKDPEGIQKITLGGGYTRHCISGDVGQNATGTFAAKTQTLAPDSDGNVLTQIFLIESYTPDVTCSGGFTWQGTSITLTGAGTNYLNGTTNGTLTINITP